MQHCTPDMNTGGQKNTSLAGVSNKRRPLNLCRALRCKPGTCICNGSIISAAAENEASATVVEGCVGVGTLIMIQLMD